MLQTRFYNGGESGKEQKPKKFGHLRNLPTRNTDTRNKFLLTSCEWGRGKGGGGRLRLRWQRPAAASPTALMLVAQVTRAIQKSQLMKSLKARFKLTRSIGFWKERKEASRLRGREEMPAQEKEENGSRMNSAKSIRDVDCGSNLYFWDACRVFLGMSSSHGNAQSVTLRVRACWERNAQRITLTCAQHVTSSPCAALGSRDVVAGIWVPLTPFLHVSFQTAVHAADSVSKPAPWPCQTNERNK